MYKKKSTNNTHIKTLGSPGISQLTLSLYPCEKNNKKYLVLKFVPCIGKDDLGFDKYCNDTYPSTSIDYEGAKAFYPAVKAILDRPDSVKPFTTQLQCGKSATLTFAYKQEQDGTMGSYLTINKDNITVPFRFQTHQYQTYSSFEDKAVTIVIHLGLKTFAEVLDGYINYIDDNNRANKLPEGSNGYQGYNPQAATGNWNDTNF